MKTLLFAFLMAVTVKAGNIDQPTFTLFLPDGWDEKVETRDSDLLQVTFSKGELCSLLVLSAKRSNGATTQMMTRSLKADILKLFNMEPVAAPLAAWGKHAVKGVTFTGKAGDAPNQLTITVKFIEIENGDNLFAIVELGDSEELDEFKAELERMRQSFQPK